MQQAQLLTLCRHGWKQRGLVDLIANAISEQWLVASATSESGTGGNTRASLSSLELISGEDEFRLRKSCPTLSYGLQAGAILATTRRDAHSSKSDQILTLLMRDDYDLMEVREWRAMGMRGTMTVSASLNARVKPGRIFDEAFRSIAAQTMTPVSHVLWAACWLGVARHAVTTATAWFRAGARARGSDASRGALLARAVGDLDMLQTWVSAAAHTLNEKFAASWSDDVTSAVSALQANNIKLVSSRLARNVCLACLECCGLDGYREDGAWTVARAVRDVLSAPLMISNERLATANATLLQIAQITPSSSSGI
jgi:acyl-CoA dehydrogenase